MGRPAFKTVAGKFSSSKWRAGNAARMAGTARAAALSTRRAIRRSGYQLARRVAVNRERKYFDTDITALPFDNDNLATSTAGLNIIPQGDSVTQRIGKKVSMKAVQLKGTVVAGTSSNDHATLLLVYDRNPNQQAALPLPYDVVAGSSGGAFLSNRDWSERFKILRRWHYAVVGNGTPTPGDNAAGYAEGGSVIPIDEYISLKGLPTEWSSANSSGAVANMVKGSLFLVAVSDRAPGAARASFSGRSRVDFED